VAAALRDFCVSGFTTFPDAIPVAKEQCAGTRAEGRRRCPFASAPSSTHCSEGSEPHASDLSPSGCAVSGALGGAPRSAIALALARQVAARPAALHRPCVPLDRIRPALAGRVHRLALRRSLPAWHLRLQPRRPSLELAGRVLCVRRQRHRPLPAFHAYRRHRLSRPARDRVPGAAAARSAVDRLVAARGPPVRRRMHLRRRRRRSRVEPHRTLAACAGLGWADRPARSRRSDRAALPRRVSTLDLRLRARPQPLGLARRRLRGVHDSRVPAVPPRQRRE
jgi:hypothetical protein